METINIKAGHIPKLINPIMEDKADVVVGDRQLNNIEHFSFTKKILQRLESCVVRQISKTNIKNTTSGFRAYSKEAALRLNIVSHYTYTLESIIQAGNKRMKTVDLPITTNKPLRKSRLFTNILAYVQKQATTIMRMYTMFQPLKVFSLLGITSFSLGSAGVWRFLYFYFTSGHAGHIQSLVLAGAISS